MEEVGNRKAKLGYVFVCFACGKTSEWKYGFDNAGINCQKSRGWDESCMMNSEEVSLSKLEFSEGGEVFKSFVVKVN
jgi:hypothetical protein